MKTIILSLLVSLQCLAGNSVENGGDAMAAEFVQIARTSLFYLKSADLSSDALNLVDVLEKSVNETTVNSAEKLILRGEEVNAINYPLEKKIVISRKRWTETKLSNPANQANFVLHEYLGASGIDDSRYSNSQMLVGLIKSQLHEDLISNEMVQGMLGNFLTDILLFNMDLDQMLATGRPNYEALCTDAGAFQSQSKLISQIIVGHLYWFSKNSESVKSKIEQIELTSEKFTNYCLEKNVDLSTAKAEIVEADLDIKYIFQLIQFPE